MMLLYTDQDAGDRGDGGHEVVGERDLAVRTSMLAAWIPGGTDRTEIIAITTEMLTMRMIIIMTNEENKVVPELRAPKDHGENEAAKRRGRSKTKEPPEEAAEVNRTSQRAKSSPNSL